MIVTFVSWELKILGFSIYKKNPRAFKLRGVSPAVFLDKGGLPYSFFCHKNREVQMHEIAFGLVTAEEDEEKKEKEAFDFYKMICEAGVISLNKKPFDIKLFLKSSTDKSYLFSVIYALYINIIGISTKIFKSKVEMSSDLALYYDAISEKYGKAPIEMLCPNGGYTDLDAQMFNLFVASEGAKKRKD